MRDGRLDWWEIVAAGLALGVIAHASTWIAAAMLLLALAWLLDEDRVSPWARAALPALAGISLAAVLWGPAAMVAAALAWRIAVEIRRTPHAVRAWTAPVAALAWRLGAPDLLVWGLACIAFVAWLDWLIGALARWRLEEHAADHALPAQAVALAPLLAFSDPTACLVAYLAMGLARAVVVAPRPGYALAR